MSAPVILDAFGKPARLSRRSTYAPGGYLGASWSTRRSILPGTISDAWSELSTYTRNELTRKARFLQKNVGLVRGVRKSLVDQAIGPGVYPLPATDNDTWNELAWAWMWETAKIGDVSGRMTLWEAQRMRTGHKFTDGELYTAHVRSANGWPQFQLIRSHNCGNFDLEDTEDWIDGVQLDSVNRARAYHFRLKGDNYKTLPAASVVHSYMLEDADAVHGVTALAHAINHLNDMLDSLELEMHAVKDNGRVSRVIETDSGENEDEMDPVAKRFADAATTPEEKQLALKLEQVFGGEIVRLKRGEKLSSFASARPSPTFTGFIDWLGKMVTNGCGFPYEYAWNPNELKGPGVRFILEKVRLAVEEWRRNEIEDTYPFYTFAISCAMEMGELPYNPQWFKVEWIGGSPDVTIDRGRDSAQDRDNIKAALDTFKRYYARQGLWWKTELRQKAKEAGFIGAVAKEYGVDVDRVHLLLVNGSPSATQQPSASDGASNPADGEDQPDPSQE